MSTKALGIVIPTHNRCSALLTCLAHLENQIFKDFEVIVVDDGSSDTTQQQMEAYQANTSLCLQYVRQKNSGPAKARNLGISMLSSPICLMLGDDIFPSSALAQLHVQLHQSEPDLTVVGLGYTRWAMTGQKVTTFMRWLDEANLQFSYPLLLAGAKPDWRHFYTSNLSVKTELLRRFRFNESFPYAAMEDMELAYRIERSFGLDVRFLPQAVADHLHPTTFLQACRRMVRVGSSFGFFYELWPEQKPYPRGRRQAAMEMLARSPRMLKLLTSTTDLISKAVFPRRLISFVLYSHFEAGLQSRRKL